MDPFYYLFNTETKQWARQGHGYAMYWPVDFLQFAQFERDSRGDPWVVAMWEKPVPPTPPEPAGPAFELPIDLTTELETNTSARWPFPQLRPINHREYKPPRQPEDIKHITLHHTAGTREGSTAVYCHDLHTKSKSWSRCGYHLFCGSLNRGDDIELYEINPWEWITWHDSRNHDTYAVTMAGWLSEGHDVEPNDVQLDCFGRAMAYALPMFPALESIVPHKMWQATACPGDIDMWWTLLVDAATQYGQDIAPLLDFQRTRRRRFSFQTLLLDGPPLADYEEV